MNGRPVIDWVQRALEGGLIGDLQVIRTQVIGIGCKWWLMTVVTVKAVAV